MAHKKLKRNRAERRRARVRERREQRGGSDKRGPEARKNPLAALGAAALALPGLAGSARADAPRERFDVNYRYSYYKENNLKPSRLAAGSRDRYEIQVHQLQTVAPLTSRMDLQVDVAYETMSGASPWYVVPNTQNPDKPLQVMTGATINEERTDASAKGNYYFDEGRAGVSAGVSYESDYLAYSGGVDGEMHFNDGLTTLSGGVSGSYDIIDPTDKDFYATRPQHKERKKTATLFGGISRVINRNVALQSSVTYKFSDGYLSDPYKQVFIGGNSANSDVRPDQRNQVSILTRYRHHIETLEGTLNADYRFYIDDWEINSHTLELAWHQAIWDSIKLIPSFRYYTQSQAKFYAPYFDSAPADGLQSSDYRLSPYGALSWGIAAEAGIDVTNRLRFDTTLSWRQYVSSANFALSKVEVANPGLVNYHVFSLGVRARF